MLNKSIRIAATMAVFLALFVVMLGAYTRLTDAGLGCPDWPGCYGHIVLPSADIQLQKAQATFPQVLLETRKAWTEMAHRYIAGILGLLIIFIGLGVLYKRFQGNLVPWRLPLFLLILVFFQAALGMWTVTLKLLPIVVMGHLLGGILIFACLSCFRLQISALESQDLPQWRPWVILGLIIIFGQIALGGWVSSNYAGISCIGFPKCNGVWLPDLYFLKAFNLFSSIGANYQGGLLDNEIRITIQFMHRIGAIITALYVLILSIFISLQCKVKPLRITAWILLILVLSQFILGILNVYYLLPLKIAVAHNGLAALLLATVFSMVYFTKGYKYVK